MTEANHTPESHPGEEQHILVIDDHDCGVFALDAATYSIGRDKSNAIVLRDESVSRQHALLLRMPIPGENLYRYRYRLLDGNAQGKRSANGTQVNGVGCQSHDLVKGDTIQFGKHTFCTYMVITGEEAELSQYLESTKFQSIKANYTDPKATLYLDSQADIQASQPSQTHPAVSGNNLQTSQSTQHRLLKWPWKIVLGTSVGLMLCAAGLWLYFDHQQQHLTAPNSTSS